MTRKDYRRAAEMIRIESQFMSAKERQLTLYLFSQFFRGGNPRFDKNRFEEACAAPNQHKRLGGSVGDEHF